MLKLVSTDVSDHAHAFTVRPKDGEAAIRVAAVDELEWVLEMVVEPACVLELLEWVELEVAWLVELEWVELEVAWLEVDAGWLEEELK